MSDITNTADSKKAAPVLFARWAHLSLAGQFMITGSLVVIGRVAVIGAWVTKRKEDDVTRDTAISSALFMESVVAPIVQELAEVNRFSSENQAELDRFLKASELGHRIISVNIWKQGGLIAYSSRHSIIAMTYPITPNLRQAWTGEVTAEFDKLEDEENALEREAGLPLLEMYSPINQSGTGRIIAVAEFYETDETLNENLFWATLESWIAVARVTLAMLGALSGIVFVIRCVVDRED